MPEEESCWNTWYWKHWLAKKQIFYLILTIHEKMMKIFLDYHTQSISCVQACSGVTADWRHSGQLHTLTTWWKLLYIQETGVVHITHMVHFAPPSLCYCSTPDMIGVVFFHIVLVVFQLLLFLVPSVDILMQTSRPVLYPNASACWNLPVICIVKYGSN